MDEFIEQWVRPYYLNILHGNYCFKLKGDEQISFNRNAKNGLDSVSEEIVNQLLSGGWREQITGSWFCGLKNWSQFTDTIGAKLVESKMTYAGQGHCFALASFANEKSVRYFTEYLEIYLPQPQLIYDQAWVMPALMWIDARNGTHHAEKFISPGGLWENYVADKKSDVLQLSYCKEKFWSLMNYCQENFLTSKAG